MKSLTGVLVGCLSVFGACQIDGADDIGESAQAIGVSTDLIAGGGGSNGVDIGDVEVSNDASTITVTYNITDSDWCLTGTHLHLAADEAGLPQNNKGNPTPGAFDYGANLSCASSWTETIDYSCAAGETVAIASHADTESTLPGTGAVDLTAFAAGLPTSATYAASISADSLFDATFSTGFSDNPYAAWSGDASFVPETTSITVEVYSSYDSTVDAFFFTPENLDNANWLLNAGFVGSASTCGGAYTPGDLQVALYLLLDSTYVSPFGLPFELCRAQELVDAALADGEGFTPACGDTVAVVLKRFFDTTAFIEVTPECSGGEVIDESAWGAGDRFVERGNWATYFDYTCN